MLRLSKSRSSLREHANSGVNNNERYLLSLSRNSPRTCRARNHYRGKVKATMGIKSFDSYLVVYISTLQRYRYSVYHLQINILRITCTICNEIPYCLLIKRCISAIAQANLILCDYQFKRK